MENKPVHDITGIDPFTYAKADKRQKLEKQKLSEMKNKLHAANATQKKDTKILAPNSKPSLKHRDEGERN